MNKAPENTQNLGNGNFAFLRKCLNSVKLLSLAIALSSTSIQALDSARAFKGSDASTLANLRRANSFNWRVLLGSADTFESLKAIVDPQNKDPFSKLEEDKIKFHIEEFSAGRINIQEFSKNLFKIIDANPNRDSATKALIKHNVSFAWGLPSEVESQFVDLANSKKIPNAVIDAGNMISADLLRIANSSKIDTLTGRTLVAEGGKSTPEIEDASISEGSSFVASNEPELDLAGRPVAKDDNTEIASVSKIESGGNIKINLNDSSASSVVSPNFATSSPVFNQDNVVQQGPDTGVVNSAVGVGGIALAATLVDRNLKPSPLRRPSSVTTSSQAVSSPSAASNTVSSSASLVSPVAVSDLGANEVSNIPFNSSHTSVTASSAPGSRIPASVVAAPIPVPTSVRAPVASNFEAPRLPDFNTIPSELSGVHSSPTFTASTPDRAFSYSPSLRSNRSPEVASSGPKTQTGGGDARSVESKPKGEAPIVELPKTNAVASDDGAPKRSDRIIKPEEADPIGRPRVAQSRNCPDIFRALAAH